MRNITAKTILSNNNAMNVYRGCTHGCIYCDSRSECYGMTYEFENIQVKANAPELLDAALTKKKSKCVISTGAMTDPYMSLEKEIGMTRKCLEIIAKHGFGAAVLTKSDLILRDMDLLKRINEEAVCYVQMTMTTFDEELCKKLEPGVCTTGRRYEVLKEMQKEGIPTVVWLTPTLPFINDTEENVKGILDYCIDAGVKGILTFGSGMTLRRGNREYYYKKLDELFPGLKKKYMHAYGMSYGIKSPNSKKLESIVKAACKENGIVFGTSKVFEMLSTFKSREQQLSLW